MKTLFLELLFISSFLTCVGIIEMDYTTTPAERLELKSTDSNTRVAVISQFLKEVLGDEFNLIEESDEGVEKE